MTSVKHDSLGGMVEHLFRHKSGEMIAALVRSLGAHRIDLAEEVVQEAMLAALQRWPFTGVPQNPGGWLYAVARNRALDRLRREGTQQSRAAVLPDPQPQSDGDAHLSSEVVDDQLRMMFICCHPDIPPESQIALTLKTVSGFTVTEIARALLARTEAIAQRLVRAKRTIRERQLVMEIPSGKGELEARLGTVLETIYLTFNEGYSAAEGEDLVRHDLADEAIRLGRIVAAHPRTALPASDALLALMLMQAARFPARRSDAGRLLLLADQDRSRWDGRLIAEGFWYFERSARGEALSRFHVEAAIAAVHVTAKDYASTDWRRLVALYDQLMRMNPSPVTALNRAVAIGKCDGAEAGLSALSEIGDDVRLRSYPLAASVEGELWLELGEKLKATACFERALQMPMSVPEREFLLEKLRGAGG